MEYQLSSFDTLDCPQCDLPTKPHRIAMKRDRSELLYVQYKCSECTDNYGKKLS